MGALAYVLSALGGGSLAAVVYFAIKALAARSDASDARVDAATERGAETLLREQNAALVAQIHQLGVDLAAANLRVANLESLYARATTGAPPGPDSRDGFLRAVKDLPGASGSDTGRATPAVPVGSAASAVGDGLIDPFRE